MLCCVVHRPRLPWTCPSSAPRPCPSRSGLCYSTHRLRRILNHTSRDIARPHAPSGVAAFMSAHSKNPYITPSMNFSSRKGGVRGRRVQQLEFALLKHTSTPLFRSTSSVAARQIPVSLKFQFRSTSSVAQSFQCFTLFHGKMDLGSETNATDPTAHCNTTASRPCGVARRESGMLCVRVTVPETALLPPPVALPRNMVSMIQGRSVLLRWLNTYSPHSTPA